MNFGMEAFHLDIDNSVNVSILSFHGIPQSPLLTELAEEKNKEVRQRSVRGADDSSTGAGRCNSGAVGIFKITERKDDVILQLHAGLFLPDGYFVYGGANIMQSRSHATSFG